MKTHLQPIKISIIKQIIISEASLKLGVRNYNRIMVSWAFMFVLTVTVNPVLARSPIKKNRFKVLIFCKTAGFHHSSIASGIVAIQKLGHDNGFDVDTTTDGGKFEFSNLKQYDA